MKNFKLILMVAVILTAFSGQVFAGDPFGLGKISTDIQSGLGSISNQVRSGISGLQRGDYSGVASGIGNFAVTTMTTAPFLSQAYGLGQSTRLQLNSIYSGLSSSYATGGFTGIGRYTLGLGGSGLSRISELSGMSDLKRIAGSSLSGMSDLKMIARSTLSGMSDLKMIAGSSLSGGMLDLKRINGSTLSGGMLDLKRINGSTLNGITDWKAARKISGL